MSLWFQWQLSHSSQAAELQVLGELTLESFLWYLYCTSVLWVNWAVTGRHSIVGKGFVSGLMHNLCTVTDRNMGNFSWWLGNETM